MFRMQLRKAEITLALLLICSFAASIGAAGPASEPTTQISSAQLPANVIRQFGDTIFWATTSDDFRSADFSPDGQRLATSGLDGRIWNVQTGQCICQLHTSGAFCEFVVYLDSSRIAAAWHDSQKVHLFIHNANTGARLSEIPCDETKHLLAMGASRDGNRIVTVGERISLIDTQAAKLVADLGLTATAAVFKTENFPAARVQFTDDSRMVMVLGEDMKAHFYDAVTGEAEQIDPFSTRHGAVMSDDGRTIAALNEETQVFDVASRQRIPLPEPTVKHHGSADPDLHSHISCARMGAGGLLAVASSAPDPLIFIWDTTIKPIPAPRSIRIRDVYPLSLVFSRDGHNLAVLSPGTRPEIVELATGKPICRPATHMGDITAMDISKDGTRLVTGDSRGTVALWEIATGRRIAMSDGAGWSGIAATPGGGICFNSTGDKISVGAEAGSFQVFDGHALKLLSLTKAPKAATQPVTNQAPHHVSAIPSPDGTSVAEWFPNLSMHLYDLEKHTQVMEITPAWLAPRESAFRPTVNRWLCRLAVV